MEEQAMAFLVSHQEIIEKALSAFIDSYEGVRGESADVEEAKNALELLSSVTTGFPVNF